jgi:hypothetical protein
MKTTRALRERELLGWLESQSGNNTIVDLWKKVRGFKDGEWPMDAVGTLLRQEMIPEILNHEYPEG